MTIFTNNKERTPVKDATAKCCRAFIRGSQIILAVSIFLAIAIALYNKGTLEPYIALIIAIGGLIIIFLWLLHKKYQELENGAFTDFYLYIRKSPASLEILTHWLRVGRYPKVGDMQYLRNKVDKIMDDNAKKKQDDRAKYSIEKDQEIKNKLINE